MIKHIRFIVAVIILVISNALIYAHVFSTSDTATNAHAQKEFPGRISNWVSNEVLYDKEVLRVLSTNKIIYKSYHRNGGPPITLFIGYYDTLEKADFSHSPTVCFTGQGWEIKSTTQKEIPIDFQNMPKIKVNQIIQTKLDTTLIALFWYQSAHRAYTNRGIQKFSLFFDKLLGKPENNAFIRITMNVPSAMSIKEANANLVSFVQDLYPELRRFFL